MASDPDSAYMKASTSAASQPSLTPDRMGSSTANPMAVARPTSENVEALVSIVCVTADLSKDSRLLTGTEMSGGLISPVVKTSPSRNENPKPATVSAPSATGSRTKC